MKRFCLALLLLLLGALPVQATDYWVALNGGTTVAAGACTLNDGPTDPGAYMRTIADGLSCLSAGDTLRVKATTPTLPAIYPERIASSQIPSGTSTSNRTQIIAHDGAGTVILRPGPGNTPLNLPTGQYITIDGLDIDAVNATGVGEHAVSIGGNFIRLTNFSARGANNDDSVGVQISGSDNELLNCRLHNNGKVPTSGHDGYGTYIGGDRNLIERCEVFDNGSYGIQQFDSAGGSDGNIIRYNTIHDNGRTFPFGGITIGRGTGNKVYGNLIYNDAQGITVNSGCVACPVDNNTVVNSGTGIYWIEEATIRNNILRDNIGGNIVRDGAATGTSSNNLCHGNGGADNCNINADPRFVNLSENNFLLCLGVSQPVGCPGASPGLNAGVNLFTQGVTSDIDGNARPSTGPFDLGAYQRSTAPSLVVSITSPNSTGSSSTTSATTNLAGIASSNVSVTIVNWVNDRGGSGTMEGTNKWSTTGIPLQMGVNVITVTAVDSGANQVQATHTIFRSGTGPVLAMGFEEVSGTTATDSSGNNNHGTIGSGVTRTTAGKIGRALIFANQSTSHITIPNSSSLSFGNVFTVSLSAYPTQAFSDWRALLVRNYSVFFYAFSDPLGFGCSSRPLGGYVSGDGSTGYIVCDSTALTLDAWNDLALVSDGTNVTFYRDGNPVGSVPATEAITTAVGSGTLQIGASDFGENFTGMIDHVRIYNRALSQSEIQADIAAQIGVLSGITVKMGPLSKQVYGPGAKEVFGK